MNSPLTKAKILKVTHPPVHTEGKGAQIRRVLGAESPKHFDPFLLLDSVSARLPGGLLDHPHRGIETITYVTEGAFVYEDFNGREGVIDSGELQWVSAGRGIVHAEMPAFQDRDSNCFQLWVNLKGAQKMSESKCLEAKKDQIPVVELTNAKAKVICGNLNDITGPIMSKASLDFFDIWLESKAKIDQPIKQGWNTFIFFYKGNVLLNGEKVEENSAVFFGTAGENWFVEIENADTEARILWISGQPLKEPIVQYGPFVMNTTEQIEQTLVDINEAKNGFENLQNWISAIKRKSEAKF